MSRGVAAPSTPLPPNIAVAELYRQALPIPISFGINRGAAAPFFLPDQLESNQIGRPDPQFRVILLHITYVISRCIQ